MKIIAFLGSPRVDGNTDILLTEAIRAIEEEGHDVTLFRPYDMRFSSCISCGSCDKTARCVVDDDMEKVYKAIREGDRFVIASPVYFFSLPAQLKAIIDRCQSFWCEKYLMKKIIQPGPYGRKGLLLMVSAQKKEKIFKCCDKIITAFLNTISVPEHEILTYTGVDEKGEIKNHPTALRDAYEAGKRLVKGEM